jgi:hypothetical protein
MADGVCFWFFVYGISLWRFDFTLILGLKDGIARIVRTFGNKLFPFKFPPRVGQKLQGFLDYCWQKHNLLLLTKGHYYA